MRTYTLIIMVPSGLIECRITVHLFSLDYPTDLLEKSLLVTMETESWGNQSSNYRQTDVAISRVKSSFDFVFLCYRKAAQTHETVPPTLPTFVPLFTYSWSDIILSSNVPHMTLWLIVEASNNTTELLSSKNRSELLRAPLLAHSCTIQRKDLSPISSSLHVCTWRIFGCI